MVISPPLMVIDFLETSDRLCHLIGSAIDDQITRKHGFHRLLQWWSFCYLKGTWFRPKYLQYYPPWLGIFICIMVMVKIQWYWVRHWRWRHLLQRSYRFHLVIWRVSLALDTVVLLLASCWAAYLKLIDGEVRLLDEDHRTAIIIELESDIPAKVR